MYGKGCLKFANGDIYNGEWKKGIKDGWGEYTFADGSVKVRENCNWVLEFQKKCIFIHFK